MSDEQVIPHATTLTTNRRPELVRSTDEVAGALDDENTLIINALDPATYRGESRRTLVAATFRAASTSRSAISSIRRPDV